MSNLVVYSVTQEQRKDRLKASVVKEIDKLSILEGMTTADYIMHLRDRLDAGLINETLFRAVRDELTYRGRPDHS